MNSGLVAKIKAFGLLAALAFSIFFAFAAPYELHQVYTVNGWEAQPATLQRVEQEQSWSSRGGAPRWRFELTLIKTGERVSTSDVRPGDLPFTIDFPFRRYSWSPSDRELAQYQVGQTLEVFRSPEGGKTFLERGSYGFMSGIWLACLAFWLWMWRRAKRLKGHV